MAVQTEFRKAVEAALVRHSMTPTAFGRAARKDPNFVFRMRTGRSHGGKVMDEVYEFIARLDSKPRAETREAAE